MAAGNIDPEQHEAKRFCFSCPFFSLALWVLFNFFFFISRSVLLDFYPPSVVFFFPFFPPPFFWHCFFFWISDM